MWVCWWKTSTWHLVVFFLQMLLLVEWLMGVQFVSILGQGRSLPVPAIRWPKRETLSRCRKPRKHSPSASGAPHVRHHGVATNRYRLRDWRVANTEAILPGARVGSSCRWVALRISSVTAGDGVRLGVVHRRWVLLLMVVEVVTVEVGVRAKCVGGAGGWQSRGPRGVEVTG